MVRHMHQKTVQHCWVNIARQQVVVGGCLTHRDMLIQPMGAAVNRTTFLTQAQSLSGKAIGKHTTRKNAEVKCIINKYCRVAPKWMPLGAHLSVYTHNMGRCFAETLKNARWLASPQETRERLENIVEFPVQIKGKQHEYESKT